MNLFASEERRGETLTVASIRKIKRHTNSMASVVPQGGVYRLAQAGSDDALMIDKLWHYKLSTEKPVALHLIDDGLSKKVKRKMTAIEIPINLKKTDCIFENWATCPSTLPLNGTRVIDSVEFQRSAVDFVMNSAILENDRGFFFTLWEFLFRFPLYLDCIIDKRNGLFQA